MNNPPRPADRPAPRTADRLIWLLFFLAAPSAYFCFALNRFSWTSEWIALALALITGISAWLLGRAQLSSTSRVLRTLTLVGAGMVVAAVLWNVAYAVHVNMPGHEITRGEFRKIRNSRHWPIYGGFHFDGFARAIPAALAIAGTVAFLIRARRRNDPVDARFLCILALLQFITTFTFAIAENRLQYPIEFQGFRAGVARFDKIGIASYLRQYTGVQQNLGTYDPHYPPGFTLLMILEHRTRLYGSVAELTLLLTALTIFPLARLASELGADASAQRWAVALFSTCTGVLVFPTLTPIALMVFPCTLLLLVLVIALRSTSIRSAILTGTALGMIAATYAFFSFSIIMLGVFVAAFLLLALALNRATIRDIPPAMIVSLACAFVVFAMIYVGVRAGTGFNWWTCLREARKNLVHSNGNYFDSIARFSLRATGNPLAYLLSCGVALAVPMLLPGKPTFYRDSTVLSRAWLYAAPIALLLAALLGMGRLETERVWTFFTPAVCIAAAFWLRRREDDSRPALFTLVMIGAGSWALAQEVLYHHY